MSRLFFIVVLAAGSVMASPVYDFGLLGSAGENVHGQDSIRAIGPLFEQTDSGDRPGMTAFRPFFTREHDVARGRETLDVLWPVGHFRWWRNETDWRFLIAFYHDPDTADTASAYRFWILPLYAQGRNKAGENYGALFPLGGRVDDWFGRDRVEFALFPLYWHSELNDLRTDHWLWPLVSRTTGDDIYKFRVFPLYGRSMKQGEGESRFVMWPFWTSVRYDHPGARGGGWMLFPIYGHSKTEASESWMVVPPFFRHTTGKKGTETIYLWPFIQSVSTKDLDKVYVWPLYGRRTESGETRRFWLWPFFWQRHETLTKTTVDHFRIFPLVAAEATRPKAKPAQVLDRYFSVWPLMSYERTGTDAKRVRFPDLWPFRDTAPIERNLSPLWTLISHERTARGWQSELLWGLARWGVRSNGTVSGSVFPLASWGHDKQADKSREWEFLKGLLGYRRDESGKTWRALYFIHWRTRP